MIKGKKYLLAIVGIYIFGINILYARDFKWVNDILIYEGPITCFDVDYKMDGTMFLGFQKNTTNYPVCFYTSSDNGLTWNLRYETSTPVPKWDKMRILVGEPVHNWFYCFFISPDDSKPYVWRIESDFSGTGQYFQISDSTSDVTGFDVAMSISDDYSMVFVFYCPVDSKVWGFRSLDYGETWEYEFSYSQPSWASKDLSIAWGPPSNYYFARSWAYAGYPSDSAEVLFLYSLDDGAAWLGTPFITNNSRRDYNPHVAASHDPNNPALWVAHTYLSVDGDADLHVQSVPTHDSIWKPHCWNLTVIADSPIPEYWGDIKFYKAPGNRHVNMAWIYDNGSTNRDVHWTWSGGDDPTQWHGDIVINDYLAHPWPFGAAPRIVYSPGAPAPGGGGVVYAGFGGQNLYFDAPWMTGILDNDSSEINFVSIYPNLITSKSPLNISLSQEGLVEILFYDVCGRLAYHIEPTFWNEGNNTLYLNMLNNGIYLTEIKHNGNIRKKAKIFIIK